MEHVTHASQPVLVHGFCGGFFLSLWCNEAEIQYTAAPPPVPDHLTKHLLPKPNPSTADSSFLNTQWSSCIIHMVPYFMTTSYPKHPLLKIPAMNLITVPNAWFPLLLIVPMITITVYQFMVRVFLYLYKFPHGKDVLLPIVIVTFHFLFRRCQPSQWI